MEKVLPESQVKLKFHTKKVVKAIDDAGSKRMLEACNEVRNTTLGTLSGSRSGRTYRVPGTSRTYTASSPGQPPAQATGRLRQSVKTAIEGEGKDIIGMVGTDIAYGKCLEFGTRTMAPRPWLKPSFEKTVPKIKQILGGKWLP